MLFSLSLREGWGRSPGCNQGGSLQLQQPQPISCLPEGVGRDTAAGQAGLAGIALSENSAPWLCHFGVLGSWPRSGREILQLDASDLASCVQAPEPGEGPSVVFCLEIDQGQRGTLEESVFGLLLNPGIWVNHSLVLSLLMPGLQAHGNRPKWQG